MPIKLGDGTVVTPKLGDGTECTVRRGDGAGGWTVLHQKGGGGGTPTETIIEDWEDNSLTGYNGYLAYFDIQTSVVADGTYALHGFRDGWTIHLITWEPDGALPYYPSPGDTFRTKMRTNVTTTGNGVQFAFGKVRNDAAPYGDQYEILIDLDPARVLLYRRDGTTPTALDVDSTVVPQPDVWYDVEIDWGLNGDITVTFYNPDGSVFASLGPVNDTTYTGGGVMYTVSTEGWHDSTRKIN